MKQEHRILIYVLVGAVAAYFIFPKFHTWVTNLKGKIMSPASATMVAAQSAEAQSTSVAY